MKKFFTRSLVAITLVGFAFGANAQDYITVPESVDPSNNSIMGSIGYIHIEWPGVSLQLDNNEFGVPNQLDKSMVTVTLNGVENTDWLNSKGAYFVATHMEGSNEQSGEGTYDAGYVVTLSLGDNAFFWKGNLQINIAPGVVTSTDGLENNEITLDYTLKDLTPQNDELFSPVSGSEFEEGEEMLIKVSWETPGDLTLNPAKPISMVLYDSLGEAPEAIINMSSYCSIIDNTLEINISSLEAGFYSLIIPEGAVYIGNDYLNFESIEYEFTILGDEEEGGEEGPETDADFPPGSISPVSGTSFNKISDLQTITVSWEGKTVYLAEATSEEDVTNLIVYYNEEPLENVNYYFTVNGEKTDATSGDAVVIDLSDSGIGGGIVKVVVPPGFVNVSATNKDDVTALNNQLEATYTLLVAPEYASEPENNATFEQTSDNYKTIRVTWPGTYFKLSNQGTVSITKDGEPLSGVVVTGEWNDILEQNGYDGDVLNISLANITNLGVGTYVVTIPEGFVDLSGIYGTQSVPNNEVMLTFKVYTNFMDDATASPDANNTEAYQTLSEVTLTWDDNVTAVDGASLEVAVIMGNVNEPVNVPASVEDGSLVINLSSIFTTEFAFTGNVSITVPTGIVQNSVGDVNNMQTIIYYVDKAGYIGNATLSEIKGESGIAGVNISWGDFAIDFNDLCTEEVTVTSANNTVPTINSVDIDGNALIVLFKEDYGESSTLTITVPEGYVLIDGENIYNERQSFKVQTTSVSVISIDSDNDSIFNINGFKVNKNNLGKGIYIINGKKVVVK